MPMITRTTTTMTTTTIISITRTSIISITISISITTSLRLTKLWIESGNGLENLHWSRNFEEFFQSTHK